MREKCIPLKHRIDIPFIRRKRNDVFSLVKDLSAGWLFKSADAAQQRRLSAAGGAEQRNELILSDINADTTQSCKAVLKNHLYIPNGKNDVIIHNVLPYEP